MIFPFNSLHRGISILSVIFICVFASGCSQMFFFPMRELVRTPETVGLDYRDVAVQSADGTELHGWFLPAVGESLGTVYFLHGNAENISTHLGSVYWLPNEGFQVFMLDYRGFGKSAGSPNVPDVVSDAVAGFKALRTIPEVDPQNVLIYGQSIGGAIAISMFKELQHPSGVKAVVIESAPSSYPRIAREKLREFILTWPFAWPLSGIVSDSYRPLDDVQSISPTPLLLIHGEADTIVPFHHSEDLFAAAHEPKSFWAIAERQHLQVFMTAPNRNRLIEFLLSCVDDSTTNQL